MGKKSDHRKRQRRRHRAVAAPLTSAELNRVERLLARYQRRVDLLRKHWPADDDRFTTIIRPNIDDIVRARPRGSGHRIVPLYMSAGSPEVIFGFCWHGSNKFSNQGADTTLVDSLLCVLDEQIDTLTSYRNRLRKLRKTEPKSFESLPTVSQWIKQ